MRWQKNIKSGPKDGDWRTITLFAWWPVTTTTLGDKTVIWLERYKKNQRYSSVYKSWRTAQIAPLEYWS